MIEVRPAMKILLVPRRQRSFSESIRASWSIALLAAVRVPEARNGSDLGVWLVAAEQCLRILILVEDLPALSILQSWRQSDGHRIVDRVLHCVRHYAHIASNFFVASLNSAMAFLSSIDVCLIPGLLLQVEFKAWLELGRTRWSAEI